MNTCEQNDALRDYAFDELPLAERPAMERHIAACSACDSELRAIQLTTVALRAIPDREIPQRIAFVSDKIFEPSPMARFVQNFFGGQLGFASACLLAGAIIFSATRFSSAGRPVEIRTVVTTASNEEVSRQIEVAVQKAVARVREEDSRLAQTALAAAEIRHKEEHRNLLTSMQESMDVMQKRMGAYTSLASLEMPTNGGGQ